MTETTSTTSTKKRATILSRIKEPPVPRTVKVRTLKAMVLRMEGEELKTIGEWLTKGKTIEGESIAEGILDGKRVTVVTIKVPDKHRPGYFQEYYLAKPAVVFDPPTVKKTKTKPKKSAKSPREPLN